MAFEFINFERVGKLLGLDGANIQDYPQMEILIESVQAAIEDHTGRIFEQATVVEEKVWLPTSKMVPLDHLPVSSVTQVLVVALDGTEAETTGYSITPYGIFLDSELTNSFVKVTYTGGFADKPPAPVIRAAELQLGYEYQNIDNIGATSVSSEGGTINRPALGLLKEVEKRLQMFIHPLKTGY